MGYSRVPEEEIVPRGHEIYERAVHPELGPEHEGKFVVIDVESGDYEVSDDEEALPEEGRRRCWRGPSRSTSSSARSAG